LNELRLNNANVRGATSVRRNQWSAAEIYLNQSRAPHSPSGNDIVIDIGGGRYLLIGHLSPGSIQAKVGDQVKLGQPIAKSETLAIPVSHTCTFRPKA
jgi:murein DD-endopeptidase MepM/ murein hydrolase activator NlpD